MPASKPFARNSNDQARLAIVVLDGPEYHVRAHYNPHQVQYQHDVGWDEWPLGELTYDATKARTMTLELFFDCFELPGETLAEDLAMLERMTLAPEPAGRDPQLRRPPIVEIINGPVPGFRCVIESVAVKVTMFDKLMRPVRANVTVKLKEVKDERKHDRDPTSLPRASYLAWTPAEQAERYREAELERRRVEVAKVGGLE